jgi:hypothetical protein
MSGHIYVIDGKRYLTVDRKAEVGDKVLVINSEDKFYKKGDIAEVVHVYEDGVCADLRKNKNYYGDGRWGIGAGDFLVLASRGECCEEVTVDQSQASEQVIEMFAALSRKIVSLESQLRDTQSNVERQAEELENARHRIAKHATMFGAVEEKVEMLTDDVITLDERTQVVNAINKYYAEGSR